MRLSFNKKRFLSASQIYLCFYVELEKPEYKPDYTTYTYENYILCQYVVNIVPPSLVFFIYVIIRHKRRMIEPFVASDTINTTFTTYIHQNNIDINVDMKNRIILPKKQA